MYVMSITIIAFPGCELHVYLYMCFCHIRKKYIVKKVVPFWGLNQLMGVVCKITHAHINCNNSYCRGGIRL